MPADPMTDQQFHEIQLSGKQLVFVFMSAVVVAVVIFLLGVSVGRGVRGSLQAGAVADAGATSDTVVPAAPPAASPKPGDLSYHDVLTGKDKSGAAPAGSSAPPAPPSAASAARRPRRPCVPPARCPPCHRPLRQWHWRTGAKASPPATDAKPTNAARATPRRVRHEGRDMRRSRRFPLAGYLQFGGYNSKENADAHVQQHAAGYAAFVFHDWPAAPRCVAAWREGRGRSGRRSRRRTKPLVTLALSRRSSRRQLSEYGHPASGGAQVPLTWRRRSPLPRPVFNSRAFRHVPHRPGTSVARLLVALTMQTFGGSQCGSPSRRVAAHQLPGPLYRAPALLVRRGPPVRRRRNLVRS